MTHLMSPTVNLLIKSESSETVLEEKWILLKYEYLIQLLALMSHYLAALF